MGGILIFCNTVKMCRANLNALIFNACFDNEYNIALKKKKGIGELIFSSNIAYIVP